MPLKAGKSKKVRSQNISELMEAYSEKGTIGNTKPSSKKHAMTIAVAIAFDKARKSGKKKRKKK